MTTRNGTPPAWTTRATRPVETAIVPIAADTWPGAEGATIRYTTFTTTPDAPIRVEVSADSGVSFGDDRSPMTLVLDHGVPRVVVGSSFGIDADAVLQLVADLLDAHYIVTGNRHRLSSPIPDGIRTPDTPRGMTRCCTCPGTQRERGVARTDTGLLVCGQCQLPLQQPEQDGSR